MNVINSIVQLNTTYIGVLEVHREIEKTLLKISNLKFPYPREPIYFKMGDKLREHAKANSEAVIKMKASLNRSIEAFITLVEQCLLNFAFMERYTLRMKKDYQKVKEQLMNGKHSDLTMSDFAKLEINNFLKYEANIQQLYDVYEQYLNEHRQDNSGDIIEIYLKMKMPDIPNIVDFIRHDAYQEVAIFQQNRIVKSKYCLLINQPDANKHQQFKEFLDSLKLIEIQSHQYQNYPQYLMQFPFITTETKIQTLDEIVKQLTSDPEILELARSASDTKIRRIEERLTAKFIIINQSYNDADFWVRYVDIQDQEAKEITNELAEIRKNIQLSRVQKPLTVIKKNIYELQEQRQDLEKKKMEMEKKLSELSDIGTKAVLKGPSPNEIKRPIILESYTVSPLFETDALLFRNLRSDDKNPKYYVLLFSASENQYQYLGKYHTFADIPISLGLFRLISDQRYNTSEIGFTIPSERYSDPVKKRQEAIDKLNANQRGMKGIIRLFNKTSRKIELEVPPGLDEVFIKKSHETLKDKVLSAKEVIKKYINTNQSKMQNIEDKYKSLSLPVEEFPWSVKDQFKKIEQAFLMNIALTKSDLRNKFLTELEKMNLEIQVFYQEIENFLVLQQYNLTLRKKSTEEIEKLLRSSY